MAKKNILTIKLGKKKYTSNKITASTIRNILTYVESVDNMAELELIDRTAELLVGVYNKKFTTEELLDNLTLNELIEEANKMASSIIIKK